MTPKGDPINGDAMGDRSGLNVVINHDGSVVGAGAPYNWVAYGPEDSGYVRVFEFNDESSSWIQKGQENEIRSGECMSLDSSGSTIAIGVGNESGHVTVYDWILFIWIKRGEDFDHGQFGSSVSLNDAGTVVAIGSPFASRGCTSGVMKRNGFREETL